MCFSAHSTPAIARHCARLYTLFHFIQLQEVRTFVPHVQGEIQFSLNGSILVGVGAEEEQWQEHKLLSQRGLSLITSSSTY